jgi:hypothetical protein
MLSLDLKFQISPKTISHEKFLPSIEAKISQTDIPKAEIRKIRNRILSVLSFAKNPINKLNKKQIETIKCLKNNKDLVITFSDKGNRTVVLNKSGYIEKLENVLNDQIIYKVLSKNTIEKITRNLIDLLKSLKKSKSINDNMIHIEIYILRTTISLKFMR